MRPSSSPSSPDQRPDPVGDWDDPSFRSEAVRSEAQWIIARARALVEQARALRSTNTERRLTALEQLARLRDGSPSRAKPARPDGGDHRPTPPQVTGAPRVEPSPARVILDGSPPGIAPDLTSR